MLLLLPTSLQLPQLSMSRISPQGGVGHISIPHLKPNPHALPLSDSTYLVSSEVFNKTKEIHIWNIINYPKLPLKIFVLICVKQMLSLMKCQWIRNCGGGPTAWIAAPETLALQHSSSPIPDMHPASRKCPPSTGETGVSSGHQPENSVNPCSTWMCPFLTKELRGT